MNVIPELERWLRRNRRALEGVGFALQFDKTMDDRAKHAAWLTITRRTVEGEAIAWSTGEVDITFGASGEPTYEHYDISDGGEVAALLDRLVQQLSLST